MSVMLKEVEGENHTAKMTNIRNEPGKLVSIAEENKLSLDDLARAGQTKALVQIYCDPDNKAEQEILKAHKHSKNTVDFTLEKDIHSIAYLTFMQSDSPRRHQRMVQKAVMTFILQFLLLILAANVFISGDGLGFVEDVLEEIYMGTPLLNCARLIAALLIHLTLLPTIVSAKHMLSFAKKNVNCF